MKEHTIQNKMILQARVCIYSNNLPQNQADLILFKETVS